MRIVSRLNEEEAQHQRLREIIEAVTDGEVSPGGNIEPGENLSELVTQVDDAFCNLLEDIDNLEQGYEALHREVLVLSAQCGEQEKILSDITDRITFDHALDHATIDLMDALLSSGAANSTFSGDISFEEDVVFTKEDLKPMLRQAIETWVTLKVH